MSGDNRTEKTAGELAELAKQLEKAAGEISAALCGVANEWDGDAKRVFLQKATALGEHITQNADALAKAGEELHNAVVAAEKKEDGAVS